MNASADEDLSLGYLENDGEDEDEYDMNNSPSHKHASPIPKSMMTITAGKSPAIDSRYKRTIKLKVSELPAVAQSQETAYHSNMKSALAVSNSQKVIDNKNTYMEGSTSKKSL